MTDVGANGCGGVRQPAATAVPALCGEFIEVCEVRPCMVAYQDLAVLRRT